MRVLPNGVFCSVVPFHVCLKGMEDAVLCRSDADYDALVKIIFLSTLARNVIAVIYAVLSNHFHVVILAASQEDADAYGEEVKRRFSMWLSKCYGVKRILHGIETKAIMMTDRMHIRNALAYVPRNALDNGQNVDTYKWSGYRGMFCRERPESVRPVSGLTSREKRAIMHTCENLSGVSWALNDRNELEPFYTCDHAYLEQAFENDQAYFLKTIGSLNIAETRYNLEEKPFDMSSDSEVFNELDSISKKWFEIPVASLTKDKKFRILPYYFRTRKTTVAQLARVLGLARNEVRDVLRLK